jgi:hypothetical protein
MAKKKEIIFITTDEEIQNVAKARFGEVLRPLAEIGRESVIEELEAYDRFLKMKEERSIKWQELIKS